MLVKDVIMNVCKILSYENICKYLNDEIEVDEDINKTLDELMTALNMANNNIATNFIHIKKNTKIVVSNNKISFTQISNEKIFEILKIKKNNHKINNYKIVYDGIEIMNGEYEVEYSFLPSELSIKDDINYYSKMNLYMFSYLVLAEYFYIKGFIDDGNNWYDKFESQIKNATKINRSIMLPQRRWL